MIETITSKTRSEAIKKIEAESQKSRKYIESRVIRERKFHTPNIKAQDKEARERLNILKIGMIKDIKNLKKEKQTLKKHMEKHKKASAKRMEELKKRTTKMKTTTKKTARVAKSAAKKAASKGRKR